MEQPPFQRCLGFEHRSVHRAGCCSLAFSTTLGTPPRIGGSLAHADPAADYPASILALEAELIAQNGAGRRQIPARTFFAGLYTTALRADEVLTAVRVPTPSPGTGWAYAVMPHAASGFATVGGAALVAGEGDRCKQARVGVTGLAATPFRATGVESALDGQPLEERTAGAAARQAAAGIEPLSDLAASAEYRRHLAEVLTKRALLQAFRRVR